MHDSLLLEYHQSLDAIEGVADMLFHAHGIRFAESPTSTVEPDQATGYFVIAVEETTREQIGFARVVTNNRFAHLEQLSVDPAHARRGYGRSLVAGSVAEAKNRAYPCLTLRTYDEIPWNRPFYESCGFSVITTPVSPFFTRITAAEESLGLSQYGKRVSMGIRT